MVAEVRKMTQLPIIAKLTPNVTDIIPIAQAVENAGANALSLTNTLVGTAIDVERQKPILSTIFGGLSGPAIKPIALANIYKLSKSINIPIIGIGGISNHQDVIEFLLAGSSFTQLGTINYKHPNLIDSIITNIENFMREKSIDNIKSIIGALTVDD